MTRAADRLVVCGAARRERGCPQGCWYELVRDALKPELVEEAADDGDGTVLALAQDARTPAEPRTSADIAGASAASMLPAWLARNAPKRAARRRR